MRIRALVIGTLFAAAAFVGPASASAEVAPAATPVSTSSSECALGLLAGLIAALTTGSSAAVGCPTSGA